MHALVLDSDRDPTLSIVADRPLPVPAAGEVLVRVDCAGICATDLELTRGYMQFAGVPGHEFVGTVVEGPDELCGRRVVAEINCACHQCAMCQRGMPNHCLRRTVLGIAGRDGAFAEYLTVPAENCHSVPDAIGDVQAVFVEPLAAAAHVLDAVRITGDMSVALLGSGRLGLLVAQVLLTTGCALTVVGRNERTLAMCAAWGATTTRVDQIELSPTFDVVVECTGVEDGLKLAMRVVRPWGTIVVKSTYADAATLDLAPLVIHELNVIGSRCGAFGPALGLLGAGRVDVESLITAQYALSDGVAAFEAARRTDHVKVLLRPGSA